MLFTAPIVTTMSVYMSVIYGILYLHIITIPLLFGPFPLYGLFTYGWKNGNDGLAYLGAGAHSSIPSEFPVSSDTCHGMQVPGAICRSCSAYSR